MRIRDIIRENRTHFRGLNIEWEQDAPGRVHVRAMSGDGERELGSVMFVRYDGRIWNGEELHVDERYQRQGIATAMYDWFKKNFGPIRPSDAQTQPGQAFWQGKKVWEQGVAEGLSEARNSLFAFVKQQFPTWPDYVLKDFLYQQAKGIRDQAELDDFLKRNKQDFGNCKWTLTKLPITFDIFTPKTQRMLASREGGSSNPFQVPRDAERHAQQSQMIQQKGVSAEPIIVAKLANGYDLIEGWHRTIQHLKAFPQGYTGPAWVCTGATYKSESVEQGVAEDFSNDMSTQDMIAYLRQHHDKNLHPDYLNHLTGTNSKFVLKNIPLNSIRTELSGLDRAKVEQYKKMDFSKAPPIVVGSDGNILDGYHRATVAKALGIPNIKAYVGVKGQQGVAEGSEMDEALVHRGHVYKRDPNDVWHVRDDSTRKLRHHRGTVILAQARPRIYQDDWQTSYYYSPDPRGQRRRSPPAFHWAYIQGRMVKGLPQDISQGRKLWYQRHQGFVYADSQEPFAAADYVAFNPDGSVVAYDSSGPAPAAGPVVSVEPAQQTVAEGVNDYLWHGSKSQHEILYPQQANDTGGKEESNKNAVYATPSAKVAIAMGLTTPGSDTAMFPNDPQMVLFSGNIRKGQMVYLHKVPKDLFIKHNSREWYSKPGVQAVKPIEVVKVPVDQWSHLIRPATPQDLELQKKHMKQQPVAEVRQSYKNEQRRSQMSSELMRSYLDLLNEQQQNITESKAAKMARIAKSCAREATFANDRKGFLKAAELFAAGDEARGLDAIERMDTEARDDFYMGCEDAGIPLPTDDQPASHGFVPSSELTPAQKKQRNAFNKALGLPLDEDSTK